MRTILDGEEYRTISGKGKGWYMNKLKEQEQDIEYLKRIVKILRGKVIEYSK